MSKMFDHVVAEILGLQVRLMACQARLAQNTDSEALHDLRTTVRRLRSLLRPLRGLPGVDQLEGAAKAIGDMTTPLRDREVLAGQLFELNLDEAAQRRLAGEGVVFASVASSTQLQKLLAVIDAFPAFLRAIQHQGLVADLGKRIEKRLDKQWQQIVKAVHDPAHDRHRLRLLIKRARYGAEAYPQASRIKASMGNELKRAQDDLGHWHDLLQWLAQAEKQADLAPLAADWKRQLAEAERKSDKTLARLLKHIDKR
ncbi:CHAD domain-containing protein [Pseudomonas sp. 148P]|uniref:CHAD domain-containing protein n=1 Tax=Pseudomonas ulcerans TaxID=3115852 RepID=A0ABU7HQQ1_9PSED|nr:MULTISPECIES: CHAD domain-containing protein [unclassified Pseudomonas]MEE1925412.1 CHAD domain-containing protein [Pseudomonas sp. 147P]MEE1933866.1 CHAD domain-containing protein [Pseudomonas sp. 148P]